MSYSSRRINALAKILRAERYLEIGVYRGETFRDVDIVDRTAVDPNFLFDTTELENQHTHFFKQTSDDFFASQPLGAPYDIAFIDGLHTFEQLVRDLSNALLRTHENSVLILDDTVPNDVYSTLPTVASTYRHRVAAGDLDTSWHGDVFKIIYYIHDFWPGLNYRTIVGSGNPQTLVWKSYDFRRAPLFDNLEKISRLTFFDLQDHYEILMAVSEEEALAILEKEQRKC
jgi:hypothetical protein